MKYKNSARQNKIFKAYLKAYKEDIFDFETSIDVVQPSQSI